MARRKNKRLKSGSTPTPAKKLKYNEELGEIYLEVQVSEAKISHKFGGISITLHDDHEYQLPDNFKMTFIDEAESCYIYWTKENGEVMTVTATVETPYKVLLGIAKMDIFYLVANSHVLHPGENSIPLYLRPSSFLELFYASQECANRYKEIFDVVEYVSHVVFKEYMDYEDDDEDIDDLYDKINNHYSPDLSSEPVTHEALIPKLRLYQSQAVRWMLQKENQKTNQDDDHPLYITLQTEDGKDVYFHKYGGFFVNQKYTREELPKGGIIADEMGLGKTLEILALILTNPKKDFKAKNKVSGISNQEKDGKLLEKEEKSASEIQEVFQCYCGHSDPSKFTQESSIKCVQCHVVHHIKCVLYEPSLSHENYTCPYCKINTPDLISSRATLIISPASIVHQWKEEILKHIKKDNLKVFMYEGVDHQKFVDMKYLSDHDIVLTSYETLRKELNYVDLPHGHSFRHPKKFRAIPSPLLSIEWWRVCLDEAQMVEGITSKSARMTSKLHCINRWCVTGTPIKKSAEDLYGLILFLDAKPYREKMWWKEAVWKPYINEHKHTIYAILNEIIWRSTKKQVIDQMKLPVCKEIIHELELPAIERVYYDQKHLSSKHHFDKTAEQFSSLNVELSLLQKNFLSKVLLPLRHLQLACSVFTRQKSDLQRVILTPQQLGCHLLKTAKYQCEEYLRKLIMEINGLGGILVLQNKTKEAAENYEKALKIIEDNKVHIRTDATQKIHCLYHLLRILSESKKTGEKIKSDYSLSELEATLQQLTVDYMEKYKAAILKSKGMALTVTRQAEGEDGLCYVFANKRPGHPTSMWWKVFLERTCQIDEVFASLIHAANEDPGKTYKRVRGKNRFLGVHPKSIPEILTKMANELMRLRYSLKHRVYGLASEQSEEFYTIAAACHLRRVDGAEKCDLCKADIIFKLYETYLFCFEEIKDTKVTAAADEDDNSSQYFENEATRKIQTSPIIESENDPMLAVESARRRYIRRISSTARQLERSSCVKRGVHAQGDYEFALQFLYKSLRNTGRRKLALYDSDVFIEDAEVDLHILELFKKEFKCLRNLWLRCSDYVAKMDEIEMAKISATLRNPQDPPPDPQLSYVFLPEELEPKAKQHSASITDSKEKFCSKKGHLFYVQNLEMDRDSPYADTCPICYQQIKNSWCVLECGHCFCLMCIGGLEDRKKDGNALIRCPVCREYYKEKYFIEKKKKEASIKVEGSYTTKMTEIIRCLLKINLDDREAKSIVCSTFPDFLSLLEHALHRNKVKCVNLCNKKNFQDNLKLFKESDEYKVLLLSLGCGSSGLNITEANHIILVEPVLDESEHLQAIGRIHRIGQTRETTVHRFYVAKTIEEKLFKERRGSSQESTELTLQNISDVFKEYY